MFIRNEMTTSQPWCTINLNYPGPKQCSKESPLCSVFSWSSGSLVWRWTPHGSGEGVQGPNTTERWVTTRGCHILQESQLVWIILLFCLFCHSVILLLLLGLGIGSYCLGGHFFVFSSSFYCSIILSIVVSFYHIEVLYWKMQLISAASNWMSHAIFFL